VLLNSEATRKAAYPNNQVGRSETIYLSWQLLM
jgi:hypothetical protein